MDKAGIIARDFKVNRRTVFRWIENGRLHCPDGYGFIGSDYLAKSLNDWNSSCSIREAKRRLNVSSNTLLLWRKNKLLKTVKVFKFTRVLLSSIQDVLKRRKRGNFYIHPKYSLPQHVLCITGIGFETLKNYLGTKIPVTYVNGKTMIPNEVVEKIGNIWRSSCNQASIGRILGLSRGMVARRMRSYQLKSVVILGHNRVSLNSMAKTPEEKQKLKEYLAIEKKKFKRRKNSSTLAHRKRDKLKKIKVRQRTKPQVVKLNKFLCKREEKFLPQTDQIFIPDYTPQLIKVAGLESRRLTNCEEGAKAIGRTTSYIENLCRAGTIRCELVDNNIFPYVSSIQAVVSKLKRGELC